MVGGEERSCRRAVATRPTIADGRALLDGGSVGGEREDGHGGETAEGGEDGEVLVKSDHIREKSKRGFIRMSVKGKFE